MISTALVRLVSNSDRDVDDDGKDVYVEAKQGEWMHILLVSV